MRYTGKLCFKQLPAYDYNDYLNGSFLSRNSRAYKVNVASIKEDVEKGTSINVIRDNVRGVALQSNMPKGCHATSFDQPTNSSSLKTYLSDLVNRIPDDATICHYTRADVLEKIIKSKKWLLGRPVRMNDKYELDCFRRFSWDSLFFGSFICNSNETVAMWVMYTNELENGVMISIRGSVFKKWINSLECAYEVMLVDNELDICRNPIDYDFSLSGYKVSYFDEKEKKFCCDGAYNLNFKDPYADEELLGYVKDEAWSYEKEFRLCFKSKITTPDVFSIAVDVPNYVFKSMKIIKGPFCNKHIFNAKGEEIHDCSKFYGRIDKTKLPLKSK